MIPQIRRPGMSPLESRPERLAKASGDVNGDTCAPDWYGLAAQDHSKPENDPCSQRKMRAAASRTGLA